MKIYLSQGVRNRNTDDIRDERDEVLELLQKAYIQQVKLVPESILYMDHQDCYFLAKCLLRLEGAELVVFLPEWEQYESCRLERMAAELFEFPMLVLGRTERGNLCCDEGQMSF